MSLKNSFQPREEVLKLEPASLKRIAPETAGLFEEILGRGSTLRVKVTGRSMAPFLGDGDIVTIRKVPPSSLQRGDLIFFKTSEGFPFLHRLIKKKSIDGVRAFQTKGDALISFDEPILDSEVLGKVCKIEKMTSVAKSKHINMESFQWRTINYIVALIFLIKSTIRHPILIRLKKSLFGVTASL